MKAEEKKGDEIVSEDPTTGKENGRIAITSTEDTVSAVERGREAAKIWREKTFDERRTVIRKAREIILGEMDAIAHLISSETGKPPAEATVTEIAPVLDLMRFFADNAEKMLRPRKINIGLFGWMGRRSEIVYQPFGVVAIISPWNYPLTIPLGETAMALMAGNSVVIKPSELTPFVGMKIGEIFSRAASVENLVQIIPGDGKTGAELVEARPDKILFTGSVATGKKIAAAAARNLISVVLELGGKDPMIVLEDADLETASSAAVWSAFSNSGQTCASVERLYVHKNVASKLTELIVAKTKKIKQGGGDDPNISVGSMTSRRQFDTVVDHVENFRASGAEILTGGKQNSDLGKLFFEPTVVTNVSNDMRAMREETFGPTLPIAIFDTEDEAIILANDSEFGLTASVWTKDTSRGKRIARRIEAGTITINEVTYTHGIGQTPWGGFKNSGLGRTHGREGLMELVQAQHIHTNRFTILPDAWWLPYSPTASGTFRGFAKYFATGSLLKTARLLPQLWKRIKELKK